MARGVAPRQPARTGRQNKVSMTRAFSPAKSKQKMNAKIARPTADAIPGSSRRKASSLVPQGRKKAAKSSGAQKGYQPLAPERVAEILKRLNDLYPDVTCALTHA